MMDFLWKIIDIPKSYFYNDKNNDKDNQYSLLILLDANKQHKIYTETSETFKQIKFKIYQEMHIPYVFQRLFYKGF